MAGRTSDSWGTAINNDDLDPTDGGATSIERQGRDPLCSLDTETGFAIDISTLDELRWYTYLSPPDLDDESLLESRNDE